MHPSSSDMPLCISALLFAGFCAMVMDKLIGLLH